MNRRTCPADGCTAPLRRWERLCSRCFSLLASDARAAICAARHAGDTLKLSRLTVEAVVWLRAHSPAIEMARRLGESHDDAPSRGVPRSASG